MRKHKVGISLFVTILLCTAWGCGGGSSAGGGGSSARLRVIDGAWGAVGPLDVVVNGKTVVSGIRYPMCVNEICTALSEYVSVKAGGVSFAVVDQGGTTNLVPSQFQTLNLTAGSQNTFVLGGSTQIGGYLFSDDDVPAANSVKLRIANADSTAGSPGAWVLPGGSPGPTGTPTIDSVALGSASSYLTLTPGPYEEFFNLICAGGDCISVGPTTFTANENVTVYLLNENTTHRPLILADN